MHLLEPVELMKDLSQSRICRKFGKDYYLLVFYLTKLIGLALGHSQAQVWLSSTWWTPDRCRGAKG